MQVMSIQFTSAMIKTPSAFYYDYFYTVSVAWDFSKAVSRQSLDLFSSLAQLSLSLN